ncbi:MAG: DUF4123 domain-containing protein [Thioploca sp.]|nr:DUF4123 domain-containing protein [Thioploca sp.]
MMTVSENLPSVFDILGKQHETLFAILDAARDEKILATLLFETAPDTYQSLFEGLRAQKLIKVSPYLVQLSGQPQLLKTLIDTGWGNSWGIYLTCAQPFHQLLEHLRSLTMVTLEDGKKAFFRFYDLRVLRVFLKICSQEQGMEFFGSINSYWMEGKEATQLLQFTCKTGDVELKSFAVL